MLPFSDRIRFDGNRIRCVPPWWVGLISAEVADDILPLKRRWFHLLCLKNFDVFKSTRKRWPNFSKNCEFGKILIFRCSSLCWGVWSTKHGHIKSKINCFRVHFIAFLIKQLFYQIFQIDDISVTEIRIRNWHLWVPVFGMY